jgi:hypothetical protein
MVHNHKFYLHDTKMAFEPYVIPDFESEPPEGLYHRVEYAILACNCGKVIKSKIDSQEDIDAEQISES